MLTLAVVRPAGSVVGYPDWGGDVTKPGTTELLIQTAIDPGLLRKLRNDPDSVFAEFEIPEDDRQILRHPDERMLALLGRAVREAQTCHSSASPPQEVAAADERTSDEMALLEAPMAAPSTLPPMLLALTVVPCLAGDGLMRYAVWVNPMAEGAVPATLPPPPGASLPGAPLAPLYAVIELDGVQLRDAEGNPQVELWAQFRQSTNSASATRVPDLSSEAVQAAAGAVHASSGAERRERLGDLLRALTGDSE